MNKETRLTSPFLDARENYFLNAILFSYTRNYKIQTTYETECLLIFFLLSFFFCCLPFCSVYNFFLKSHYTFTECSCLHFVFFFLLHWLYSMYMMVRNTKMRIWCETEPLERWVRILDIWRKVRKKFFIFYETCCYNVAVSSALNVKETFVKLVNLWNKIPAQILSLISLNKTCEIRYIQPFCSCFLIPSMHSMFVKFA